MTKITSKIKLNKNNIVNIALILVYAIITFITVCHHEIWADEAQVWQICKYLSLFELFKHLVNEGHPSFFYLINMPFAKIGFPIFTMQIICWLASCFAVGLFLQKSPFNNFAKFSIISSAGLLYFLPVIARSYSILPLLVFLLATLYPKQKERPYWYATIILLLANTHVIMFGFCFALTTLFFIKNIFKKEKNKKNNIAFTIMLIGLSLVCAQLCMTTTSNVVITISFDSILANCYKVFSEFFINFYDSYFIETNKIMFPLFGLFCILCSIGLYIGLFTKLFAYNKKIFLIALFGILFQLFVYITSYCHWIYTTRIFSAHIIMIFAYWILFKTENIKPKEKFVINLMIGIFFITSLMNGIKYTIWDIKKPYSGAKETAEFIKNNIDNSNSILVTDNVPYSIALAYYLDEGKNKYKIYSAYEQEFIKYVVWNEEKKQFLSTYGWSKYAKFMSENNPLFENKKIYAIVSDFQKYALDVKTLKDYKLIFKSKDAIIRYEGFSLYKYLGNN